MSNLWLLTTEQLIKAKHSIVSDKKDWYIDALCERLADVSDTLRQFQEVITDETMLSKPEVNDLISVIEELKNEIEDLEMDKANLQLELDELKGGANGTL
jgi:archaellum component FlaC